MGCYMSTPDNRVYVTEGKGENFIYATASCQGWRREQEDAEDCLPYFDEGGSLFVLCDGHGGAEVAKYTVEHLPDFIKNHPLYKEGKYEEALEKAFIDFDCLLRTDQVMAQLNKIAFDANQNEQDKEAKTMDLKEAEESVEVSGEKSTTLEEECKPSCSSGASTSNNGASTVVEDVDTDTLRKEAQVPLRQLLAQYTANAKCIDPAKRDILLSKFNSSPVVKSRQDDGDGNVEGPSSSGITSNLGPGTSSDNMEEIPCMVDLSQGPGVIGKSIIKTVMERYFTDEDQDSSDDGSEFEGEDSSNEDDGDDEDDEEDDETPESSTKKLRRKKHKRSIDQTDSSSDHDSDEDDENDDEDEDEDDEDEEDDDGDDEEEEDDDEDVEDEEGKDFSAYDFLTEGVGKFQHDENKKTHTAGYDSGCTVVVALVKDGKLFVASAGDSRCIMISRNGECKPMSFDHKPEDVGERRRITKAGGRVIDGRVNGGLNLSRAFGDFTYKNAELDPREQMITPCPDVKVADLDPDKIEYIFLACDGIWNSMRNQQVAKFIRKASSTAKDNLVSICVQLFRECIAPGTDGDGTGCDNMTCILAKYGEPSIENSANIDLKTEQVESDVPTTTSHKRSTNEETTSDMPTKRRCIRL